MKIIVDAMGGDNAPEAIVRGAVYARDRLGVEICLVGRTEDIERCLDGVDRSGISIVDAPEIITMEDDPSTAVRRKKNSSMAIALNLLKNGEGDAMVSAGSTGALLTGATLIVKRVHGVRRAAMAPVFPSRENGLMLIDCGANAECTPEYLLQFGYMGSFYAKRIMNIDNPRVGLLNIGVEETKGGELQHETYKLLRQAKEAGRINFVGNVEASTMLMGGVDVVVADGFSGNIALKTAEGVAKWLFTELKDVFKMSTKNMLAAAVVKKDVKGLAKKIDPNEVGGTALLGISKPVIKAHGSSGDEAFFAAIRQAKSFAESGLINDIAENVEYMRI
ncbi:MAG: phosphate acyltransferase PlsX [Oscillospiraceae bacterium]|nr:phosphate acyltransferase PlsX [Oscillospiraceae bacterium]